MTTSYFERCSVACGCGAQRHRVKSCGHSHEMERCPATLLDDDQQAPLPRVELGPRDHQLDELQRSAVEPSQQPSQKC